MMQAAGTKAGLAASGRFARAAVPAARATLWCAVALACALGLPFASRLANASVTAATLLREHGLPGARVYFGPLGALVAWAAQQSPGGSATLLGLTILATLGTLWLVECRAARGQPAVFALAAAALAALCQLDALRPGNGAAEWLLAGAFLLLLERPSRATVLGATAVAVVWCNVSGTGILALVLATALAAGRHFENARSRETAAAWLAVAGAALAALCTPASFAFPILAFRTVLADPSASGILASGPSRLAPQAYYFGFVAIVLLAVLPSRRTRRPYEIAVFCAAGICALSNGALIPFFGIAAAPLATRWLGTGKPARGVFEGRLPFPAQAAVTALLALSLALAVIPAITLPASVVAGLFPIEAAPQRLLCERVEWCSLALARNVPGLQVFTDSRTEQYDARHLELQSVVTDVRPGWRKVLRDERVSEVLAARDSSLGSLLALERGWALVASNESLVLFGRRRSSR